MFPGLRFDIILPSSGLPFQLCISTNRHLKYICLNNRTSLHVHSVSSRVCMYGPCYPSSQRTGEACGCNGQWVMFLLNESAVAFSRLSADTMTHQSDWHLDWQTHTHTATYIPPGLWQALLSHPWAILVVSRFEKQEFSLFRLWGKRYGRRKESVPHTTLSLKGSALILSAKVDFVIHH